MECLTVIRQNFQDSLKLSIYCNIFIYSTVRFMVSTSSQGPCGEKLRIIWQYIFTMSSPLIATLPMSCKMIVWFSRIVIDCCEHGHFFIFLCLGRVRLFQPQSKWHLIRDQISFCTAFLLNVLERWLSYAIRMFQPHISSLQEIRKKTFACTWLTWIQYYCIPLGPI